MRNYSNVLTVSCAYHNFFFEIKKKRLNGLNVTIVRHLLRWFPPIRNFHRAVCCCSCCIFFEPVIRRTVRQRAVEFHRTVRHVISERQSPFYVFFFCRWQCWGVLDVYCSNKFINKNIRQRCSTLFRPYEIECKLHLVSKTIGVFHLSKSMNLNRFLCEMCWECWRRAGFFSKIAFVFFCV